MTSTGNHWNEYHRAWSQLTPPLRPNHEVVAAVRSEIADVEGRALLLGVTPELAGVCTPLVAVDRTTPIVQHIWPGDATGRWALVGDWLQPSFVDDCFALCLGDGSLSSVVFPDDVERLRTAVARTLRAGGRFVCRLFEAPYETETVEDVQEAALAGAIRNFHAFKLRLAMAVAAREPEPNVRLDPLHALFCAMFPDRDDLVRRTGWPRGHVDTIDHYRGSAIFYSFPTRERLLSVVARGFSGVRFVPSGTYELSERCPLLVMERI